MHAFLINVRFLLITTIFFATANAIAYYEPLTPIRRSNSPTNSIPLAVLFARQSSCPAEQVCGEICCSPPFICNVGAFNWCQDPNAAGADECPTGTEKCSDGTSCCRTGLICDLVNSQCLPPVAGATSTLLDESATVSSTTLNAEQTETSTPTQTGKSAQVTNTPTTTGSSPAATTSKPSAGSTLLSKGDASIFVQILALGITAVVGTWML